ncbi:MAG: flavin-nucleotide-binding protein [Candidatus Nomurabacteria bacterium]
MEEYVKKFLLNAESKALATFGDEINVVPVSSIKIEGDEIWLVDYFMKKTKENILKNKNVSLVAWTGLFGYQIKGEMNYETEGEKFEKAVSWISEILPERKVKGILILKPKEVFDIAPTKNTKEEFKLK